MFGILGFSVHFKAEVGLGLSGHLVKNGFADSKT